MAASGTSLRETLIYLGEFLDLRNIHCRQSGVIINIQALDIVTDQNGPESTAAESLLFRGETAICTDNLDPGKYMVLIDDWR